MLTISLVSIISKFFRKLTSRLSHTWVRYSNSSFMCWQSWGEILFSPWNSSLSLNKTLKTHALIFSHLLSTNLENKHALIFSQATQKTITKQEPNPNSTLSSSIWQLLSKQSVVAATRRKNGELVSSRAPSCNFKNYLP